MGVAASTSIGVVVSGFHGMRLRAVCRPAILDPAQLLQMPTRRRFMSGLRVRVLFSFAGIEAGANRGEAGRRLAVGMPNFGCRPIDFAFGPFHSSFDRFAVGLVIVLCLVGVFVDCFSGCYETYVFGWIVRGARLNENFVSCVWIL